MTEAIRIDGLGKLYPSSWRTPAFEALRDVTLAVEPGEVFGFIGPNGAGKSTTIKILTGVLRPTAGSARLFGVDVALPEARRGMGYVPENPSLYDYLTPSELLAMGQQIHGVPRGDIDRNTKFWLARFGIADVAGKRIRSFSKGMVQRVALAHALAVRPRLLILDEPLSGLDPVGRKDVVDILDDYRKAGGAIFLTSHVLHDVERLADRFGLINRGRLVTVQSRAGLVDDEQKLVVHSAGEAAPDGFIADAPGRWRKICRRAELWSVLEALRSAGHAVLEIRPALALEDVFFKFIGENLPVADLSGGKDAGSTASANAKS